MALEARHKIGDVGQHLRPSFAYCHEVSGVYITCEEQVKDNLAQTVELVVGPFQDVLHADSTFSAP